MDGEWIPIILFVMIGLSTMVYFHFQHQNRKDLNRTLQDALEKGREIDPKIINSLGKTPVTAESDMRRGVLILSIGLAVLAFGYFEGDDDLYGIAMFPLFLGIGYFVASRLHKTS